METSDLDLSVLPQSPGVYLMKDTYHKIIYIGKAKNIKKRVSQYFNKSDNRITIPYLLPQIAYIDTIVVRNEVEALILENNLIKAHKPKYNILFKDDGSFFNLVINMKEAWPKIYLERSKNTRHFDNHKLIFGPYPKAEEAKKLLNSIIKFFPLRTCSNKEFAKRSRPCILFDMKKCLGPCMNLCTREEYTHLLNNAILFLEGKNSSLLTNLKKQLKNSVETENFELSAKIYKTIQIFKSSIKNQEVENLPLKATDIIGIFCKKDLVSLSVLSIRYGKLLNKYQTVFDKTIQTEEEITVSFLLQYYHTVSHPPVEVLVPVPLSSKVLEASLFSLIHKKITFTFPKQKLKKSLLNLAFENAKNFLSHKNSCDNTANNEIASRLFEICKLQNYPAYIECFDTSHLFGSYPVGVSISIKNGNFEKNDYRTFHIQSRDVHNDYVMLEELLTRRYSEKNITLPDLIIIDGGFGHLNTAYKTLVKLEITGVDVLALSKENHKHSKSLVKEKIFTRHASEPLLLPEDSPILFFLQRIRDETHRFAITFHTKRRNKETLISQIKISGIGEKKTQLLLSHFGSWKQVFQASYETLSILPGISKKDAEKILEYRQHL